MRYNTDLAVVDQKPVLFLFFSFLGSRSISPIILRRLSSAPLLPFPSLLSNPFSSGRENYLSYRGPEQQTDLEVVPFSFGMLVTAVSEIAIHQSIMSCT